MTFSQNPWKHWQIEKLCATMLPKSQKQRSSAMSLAVVTLKKGEGRLLKSGGMWIFDNEVASIMGSFVNGDIFGKNPEISINNGSHSKQIQKCANSTSGPSK